MNAAAPYSSSSAGQYFSERVRVNQRRLTSIPRALRATLLAATGTRAAQPRWDAMQIPASAPEEC
jgi:hypothetical protein